MLNKLAKLRTLRRPRAFGIANLTTPLITRTNLEYVSNPYHLNQDRNRNKVTSNVLHSIRTRHVRNKKKLRQFRKHMKSSSSVKRPRSTAFERLMEQLRQHVQLDPATEIPYKAGFEDTIEWLNERMDGDEDLKDFERAYTSLAKQLNLVSDAELLFFLRMNIAKGNPQQIDIIMKIMTQQLVGEATGTLEQWLDSKFGVTKDQLIEKMAFYLNYKKLQRQALEQDELDKDEAADMDFLEKDPFFKLLNPQTRKSFRDEMKSLAGPNQTLVLSPDFEEFDFEGLVTSEFDPIEVDIQKRYFHKKAHLLPELLGINPGQYIRLHEFMSERALTGADFDLDDILLPSVEEEMIMNGVDMDRIQDMQVRMRKDNKQRLNEEAMRERYTEIKEKIPQLEENYDYTPLKEILYSYDTLKTLDAKITRLEKETKLYDKRQPRIAELQKKLNMLVDALPGHIRKFVHNNKDDFVPQFVGREYNVKGLRWKMIDKNIPCTVLDYTDSIPNLTAAELRVLTPTEMNAYFADAFNWYKPGKIDMTPVATFGSPYSYETDFYDQDLIRDFDELGVEEDSEGDGMKSGLGYSPSPMYKETELRMEDLGITEESLKEMEENLPELVEGERLDVDGETNTEAILRDFNEDPSFVHKWPQQHMDLYSQRVEKRRIGNVFNLLLPLEHIYSIDQEAFDSLYSDSEDIQQEEDELEKGEMTHFNAFTRKSEEEEFKEIESLRDQFTHDDLFPEMKEDKNDKEDYKAEDPLSKLYNNLPFLFRNGFDNTIDEKPVFEKQRPEQDPSNSKGLQKFEHDFFLKKFEDVKIDFENPTVFDLENKAGNYSTNLHSLRDLNQHQSLDSFYYNPSPLVEDPRIKDPVFYRILNHYQLDQPENFFEMDGINEEEEQFYDDLQEPGRDRFLKHALEDSVVDEDQWEKQKFKFSYLEHLKRNLLGKTSLTNRKSTNEELAIYKSMDTDPYYQHYMSRNFQNLALTNSEVMMDKMSLANNPDLGFLLDARMDMKKLAASERPSRSILLDLKSRFDVSNQKLKNSEEARQKRQGRISSFASAHRKRSSALAVIQYPGTGKVSINRRSVNEYFNDETCRFLLISPIAITGKACRVDLKVYVNGGGMHGQGQACRLAVSKALIKLFPETKLAILNAGFLRVDMRSVESKKMALPKARKGHTYVRR